MVYTYSVYLRVIVVCVYSTVILADYVSEATSCIVFLHVCDIVFNS